MGLRGREEENALAFLGVDDDAEISGGGGGWVSETWAFSTKLCLLDRVGES